MRITIFRLDKSEDITLGTLLINNKIFCVTAEPPWLDNKKNISCIPPNIYPCVRVNSPKYGNVFEIKNVYDRTNILFHTGNTIDDTLGCILLGRSFGSLNGKRGIKNSSETIKEFNERLKDVNYFVLEIKEIS